MASKAWRLHGGGLKLLTSVLLALSTPQAIHCGTSAGSTAHHDRLATAATPAEDMTPPAETNSRSRAESALSVATPPRKTATVNTLLEVRMLDFSFSPLGPRGLQDTAIDAAGVVEEGQQHPNTNPPPSALSLRECSLGDLGVAEVARSPWVHGKAGVRALSLRQNQVTAAGVRVLLDSLRSATDSGDRLACLELDFNPIGDAGAQPLPAYLKERAARGGGGLEELSLRFCDIGPAGCRYLSSALLKSAAAAKIAANDDANNPASEAPTTAGSGTGREEEEAEGEKKVGAEVDLPPPVASGIRRLLLTGNDRLGDAGAKALASALKKDSSLQVLDLTRCKIGDDGARCLANALRSNSCLRELRLGYNDISADGAVALASLLHAGSSALECLELQGNHVGDAGAVALADGLVGGSKRGGRRRGGAAKQGGSSSRRGPGLRSLNLAGNGIGCAGGGALAEALVGGKGGGGERGGVVLEELELAGNALTLSASQAAAQAKSSSLYKSAGGALSSLLTTFVDESYYSSNTNNRGSGQDASALTPPSLGNPTGGVAERPLRCAVAELGEALAGQGGRGRGGGGGRGGGSGGGCSSLKALGLARTGLSERDAARLAAALRARPVDSPLEEVEVGLNGLSVKAAEAVRLAVESPTAPRDRSSSFDDGLENSGGRGRQRPPRQRKQRQRRRDATAPGGDAGEEPGLRSRSGAAAAAAAEERSARRSEVGEYVSPGGSVELGLFGKKVASFQQAGGSGRELDVEVFGKRVRFERTGGSPPSPRPGSSPPPSMATAELDPWSDDDDGGGGVDDDSDLPGVSAAATDGSASSWSSSEEENDDDDGRGHEGVRDDSRGGRGGAVLGSDDPDNTSISSGADDTEDWDDGGETTDGGDDEERGLDSSAAGRGKPSRRNPASRRNFNVRGGGGGGGGGGEPPTKIPGRRLWSSQDAGGAYDGEWAAGFEAVSAKDTEADCENDMDGSGAAKVEWEDGFRESRTEEGAKDSEDGAWAAGFEAVSEEAESDCESAMGGGAGESAEVEWEDGFREPSESRTEGAEDSDDGEWAAGFEMASAKGAESDCESAMGNGGAESAEVEWEAGFRESRREHGAEDGEWAAGFELAETLQLTAAQHQPR
ncbi:unnamed protein product [Ectocarpus sp. 12 AP-2014]